MSDRLEIFDRTFQGSDEGLFKDLVSGLAGTKCSAWRKSYGSSGSLHYGDMVVRSSAPQKAVYKDQGTWVVDLWDCDRRLITDTGVIDNRIDGDEALLNALGALQGAILNDLTLDPVTLTLILRHSDGALLELIPDSRCERTSEQWTVALPSGYAVSVYGERRWTKTKSSYP